MQTYDNDVISDSGSDSSTAERDKRILAALREIVGERALTDSATLLAARSDQSGQYTNADPIAVVEAETVEEVQAICRLCSAEGIAIVPRGAGTGVAGGAMGDAGEIVLSTAKMQRILEISPQNRLAVVEPGILNGTLNARLAEDGLWWPPDPASKDISTVGGNIATNAGGLLCAKYGVTREAVLALKVVLADGSLISVGHRTVKGVTGLDICALMVGSEGTLGVIVECTLKLRPAIAGMTPTLGCYFDDVDDAAAGCSAVIAAGFEPSIMELVDQPSLEAISAYTGVDLAANGNSWVLIQTDGPGGVETARGIADFLTERGARVTYSDQPDEIALLVDVRRKLYPSLTATGTVLLEDIAVPRDRLADMFRRIAEIEREYDVRVPTAAHAGDGNLHPLFVFDGTEVPQKVWDAADELFKYGLELGGTLTGEHGVGILKRRWLGDELGDTQMALQARIKKAFDPQGIMNPGKVFAV